ncbi:hypothetical protein PVAP13_7NG036017 [Panicum virgatum]|uniref:Uncharacterized protein n=1 Tax=Panicum virgatum TaxID=38727 RepID=A0A8T0PX64_PANVG|nr:hypothetical protein PVAP13_7NG036017 [Panicum virgatum]
MRRAGRPEGDQDGLAVPRGALGGGAINATAEVAVRQPYGSRRIDPGEPGSSVWIGGGIVSNCVGPETPMGDLVSERVGRADAERRWGIGSGAPACRPKWRWKP